MLSSKILNPDLMELLLRIRHTNTIVISDLGFPYWPEIETLDLSVRQDLPTIVELLEAISPEFKIGKIHQANEFVESNSPEKIAEFENAFGGAELSRLPHDEFKKMVPQAIGLIRTGDSTAYGNIIIESA